eukprot:901034-Rhodomonas_salina.1
MSGTRLSHAPMSVELRHRAPVSVKVHSDVPRFADLSLFFSPESCVRGSLGFDSEQQGDVDLVKASGSR